MNLYGVIKLLHIIAAIVFVGGLFGRQLIRAYAKNMDDVRDFAVLSHAAGRIENFMVIPGNLAVILLGVILALMSGYPIFGFLQGAAQNWLLVSNILLVLGILAVPLVFVPRGKKFDLVLKNALAQERMMPELRAALDDKLIRLLHTLEIIMVILVVVLMVLKPF